MKKIPIPVYGGDIYFFVSAPELHRYHKRRVKDEADVGHPEGVTCTLDGSHDLLVGVFDGKVQTLVHECVHAAMYVFDRCEIDPRTETAEPFAYFVDALFALMANHMQPAAPAKRKPEITSDDHHVGKQTDGSLINGPLPHLPGAGKVF